MQAFAHGLNRTHPAFWIATCTDSGAQVHHALRVAGHNLHQIGLGKQLVG